MVVRPNGGLAQLGEHLAGSQKVSGSSPLSSTQFLRSRLGPRLVGQGQDLATLRFFCDPGLSRLDGLDSRPCRSWFCW